MKLFRQAQLAGGSRRRKFAGLALAASLVLPTSVVAGLGLASSAPAGASVTPQVGQAPGTVYVPIQPCRLLDTVTGSGYGQNGQGLNPGNEFITTPNMHTACGDVNGAQIPSSRDIDAIVINLTAVNPSDDGYLTAYGAGQQPPATSTVNFVAGQTIANQATITTSEPNPGSTGYGGEITVENYQGSVDVIVDVQGYYTNNYDYDHGVACLDDSDLPDGCGLYYPLTPARVVDTRQASGYQLQNETLGPQSEVNFFAGDEPFLPGGQLPVTVTAVVLNVTAVDPSAASYLTVWGTGSAFPQTSNLNFPAGTTIPNRVIVPVGKNGEVSISNWAGNTNVVVDLDGYFDNVQTEPLGYCAFPAGSTCKGALYYPLITPQRIADTRAGSGYEDHGQSIHANEYDTVNIPQDICGYSLGTTPKCGGPGFGPYNPNKNGTTYFAPDNFVAVDVNITVTDTTDPSYLTVYPSNDEYGQPTASDLNWVPGDIISNGDLASTGTSTPATALQVYNYAGTVDAVVDLYGYYSTDGNVRGGSVG
jgi:hypothetical protein